MGIGAIDASRILLCLVSVWMAVLGLHRRTGPPIRKGRQRWADVEGSSRRLAIRWHRLPPGTERGTGLRSGW